MAQMWPNWWTLTEQEWSNILPNSLLLTLLISRTFYPSFIVNCIIWDQIWPNSGLNHQSQLFSCQEHFLKFSLKSDEPNPRYLKNRLATIRDSCSLKWVATFRMLVGLYRVKKNHVDILYSKIQFSTPIFMISHFFL